MAEQPANATPSQSAGSRPQTGRGGRRDDRRNNRDRANDAPKEFEEAVINIDRVARVVKGGRRFRFKALVVVGNRKDKVGVGVAKGSDVQTAIAKATDTAKKHLITIPMHGDTIPHEIEVKVAGAQIMIKPAAPGTGIIAGGVIRTIVGVTGIKNLLSKSLGSSNKVNIAYATIKAFEEIAPRSEWLVNRNKKPASKEEK